MKSNEKLFPAMHAFESISDPDLRIFAITCAEMVFAALFQLYADRGPGLYTRAEILGATVRPESPFSKGRIGLGMLLVSESKNYIDDVHMSGERSHDIVESLVINDHLSEYHSFSTSWQEELQRRASERKHDAHAESRTVFVSCGQFTDEEKRLGKSICALVEKLTPFTPYFAENQSSLDALTENILRRLNDCAGFIAVMHPRGSVQGVNNEPRTRASVWIEQEIAICAFMVQVLKKPVRVAAYLHRSISLEGMRAQLHLNPVWFDSDGQVLTDLTTKLMGWVEAGTLAIPAILKK